MDLVRFFLRLVDLGPRQTEPQDSRFCRRHKPPSKATVDIQAICNSSMHFMGARLVASMAVLLEDIRPDRGTKLASMVATDRDLVEVAITETTNSVVDGATTTDINVALRYSFSGSGRHALETVQKVFSVHF